MSSVSVDLHSEISFNYDGYRVNTHTKENKSIFKRSSPYFRRSSTRKKKRRRKISQTKEQEADDDVVLSAYELLEPVPVELTSAADLDISKVKCTKNKNEFANKKKTRRVCLPKGLFEHDLP